MPHQIILKVAKKEIVSWIGCFVIFYNLYCLYKFKWRNIYTYIYLFHSQLWQSQGKRSIFYSFLNLTFIPGNSKPDKSKKKQLNTTQLLNGFSFSVFYLFIAFQSFTPKLSCESPQSWKRASSRTSRCSSASSPTRRWRAPTPSTSPWSTTWRSWRTSSPSVSWQVCSRNA